MEPAEERRDDVYMARRPSGGVADAALEPAGKWRDDPAYQPLQLHACAAAMEPAGSGGAT
jgi:hypothetical protein